MPTIFGPYAATGIEGCGVVRRDRSTACQFADKGVSFSRLQWREDGRLSAAAALDHSCRYGEHDEHRSCGAQELVER